MSSHRPSRRECLVGAAAVAAPVLGGAIGSVRAREPFSISLAQWSLHRMIFGGGLDPLAFPAFARERYEIGAVEYVNQFFMDKATDFEWLAELRSRAEDAGVRSLLIMCDGEGRLGAGDDEERRRAIERHFKWIAAAKFLGCHSIRVNAAGDGDWDEDMARAADSLHRLALVGDEYGVDVIVENHGGLSSNGIWIEGLMARADHPRVGTLPDFGNFTASGEGAFDRYDGVRRMMPFARGVSAKSRSFDAEGNETETDYRRMLPIVLDAGYHGHLGIEYEGGERSEDEGIRLTKALLERLRAESD
ncbi:MAG TPA: sugar phosphate isomerase/epimerase [Planctomycetes bacterium]|nr:sugar phosphate isomerase/epimerase [Planctomycetota bacterium]